MNPPSRSVVLFALALLALPGRINGAIESEGPPRDFAGDYELLRLRAANVTPLLRALDVDRAWASFSWLPEVMPIARHSPEAHAAFDEGLYRRAVTLYEAAARKARIRERDLDRVARLRLALPGGPWWFRIDQGDALDRRVRRTRSRAARSMAADYRQVLETLDNIRSSILRASPRVQLLRQAALRRGALERLLVGDTLIALKLLEEYRRSPSAEQEWPLHFYLARAYSATFLDARRDRGVPEADLRQLRRKKNLHLLRAVELRHGLGSKWYDAVWKSVRTDELGSPRSP